MQALFDTHALLWFLTGDSRLPKRIRSRLIEPGTRLYFSPVSILEIAIKHSLKPDAMPCDPDEVRAAAEASGLSELPFASKHARAVGELPWLHRDPFDRMLLAQARTEQIILLTHDDAIAGYGDGVVSF
jgi:PIN domain nuclease of toxin-antitoxin system